MFFRIRGSDASAWCLFVVLAGGFSTAEEANRPESPQHENAQRLVREALLAELEGRNDLRNALLSDALRAWPECAPARWQDGHVRVNKAWLSVEKAQRHCAADKRLKQYFVQRASSGEKAADQLALANWCQSQGLADEERVHLMKVLQQDSRHAEAQRRLNVRWSDGQWRTADEIADIQKSQQAARAAWQRWRPIVTRWRDALESKDETTRQKALYELGELRDPEAAPALERVLSSRSAERGLEAVAALGRMDQTQATDALLRLAVLSKFEDVRYAATRELKKRAWHEFVPPLLAALEVPIQDAYVRKQNVLGRSHFSVSLFRETQDAQYDFSRSLTIGRYVVYTYASRMANVPLTVVGEREVGASPQEQAQVSQTASALRAKVVEHNRRVRALNSRLAAVLSDTVGQSYTDDPKVWWEWWTQWNETYSPEKPVVYDHYHQVLNYHTTSHFQASCFPSGTLVWTQTGLEPIQALQPGDRVLAQNQDTAELTFQSIVGTTVRPETPLVKIGFGSESISATRGHPFWVVGKGWRMAKQLKAGELLHTLHGALRIESVEEAEPKKAFNLVVDGDNTYFVGSQALLVHDNVLRRPTDCVLPGLKKMETPPRTAAAR